MPDRTDAAPPDRLRIDLWLWRARVAKTRALAARLALSGHVRVNGRRVDAAARAIRIGDVLTVALERDVLVLRVLGFGVRRGPATEARMLYERIGTEAP